MIEKAQALITIGSNGALTPGNFEGMWRMSEIMAASGMMPKGMEKPETVFVAVQMGLEVGLSPMQAVQNIAVVNGRPTIWGDAMLGLVRGSGKLGSIAETFEGTGDAAVAVCAVTRKDEGGEIVGRFGVADAKRAGLWGKSGPWTQYPRRMLQMRARGFALRDAFADVLKGLYAREEIEPEQYMGNAEVISSSDTLKEIQRSIKSSQGGMRDILPGPIVSDDLSKGCESFGKEAAPAPTTFDDAMDALLDAETPDELEGMLNAAQGATMTNEEREKIEAAGRTKAAAIFKAMGAK